MTEKEKFSIFVKRWTEFLNEDEELSRRIKPFRTFCGGPCQYPGPGPYPSPCVAFDPTGWSKAEGYASSVLDGKELVELNVPGVSKYVINLKEGKFQIQERETKECCLGVKIPMELLKEIILGRYSLLWVLADERVDVTYMPGLSLSDWTTIFEVLITAQELVETDPELWDIVEGL
ncbi:MAG: hypothetical protein ACE5I5_13095 [Candidatus Heimdallarchaeota archaeon]